MCAFFIYYARPLLGPRSCRFYLMGHLTCTEYALHQLKEHSFPRACWNIVFRLIRCNPFYKPKVFED